MVMQERPILFSGPMVRALLDGSKTQTRRLLKPPPPHNTVAIGRWQDPGPRPAWWAFLRDGPVDHDHPFGGAEIHGDFWLCPYGQPGDRLWVRETFVQGWPLGADGIVDQYDAEGNAKPKQTWYRATSPDMDWCDGGDDCPMPVPWKPSIHMPRWASRITLEITEVRVERLQDISEQDAQAEGIAFDESHQCWPDYGQAAPPICNARGSYRLLWQSINGPGSWTANPWVWAVSFKRVTP